MWLDQNPPTVDQMSSEVTIQDQTALGATTVEQLTIEHSQPQSFLTAALSGHHCRLYSVGPYTAYRGKLASGPSTVEELWLEITILDQISLDVTTADQLALYVTPLGQLTTEITTADYPATLAATIGETGLRATYCGVPVVRSRFCSWGLDAITAEQLALQLIYRGYLVGKLDSEPSTEEQLPQRPLLFNTCLQKPLLEIGWRSTQCCRVAGRRGQLDSEPPNLESLYSEATIRDCMLLPLEVTTLGQLAIEVTT